MTSQESKYSALLYLNATNVGVTIRWGRTTAARPSSPAPRGASPHDQGGVRAHGVADHEGGPGARAVVLVPREGVRMVLPS